MKKIVSFLMLSFIAIATFAQFQEPVTWNVKFEKLSDTEAEISFVGQIERGWHVYSTDLGDGGPISATFNVDKIVSNISVTPSKTGFENSSASSS